MEDNHQHEVVEVTKDGRNIAKAPHLCDVCRKNEMIGVASSTLGAVSFAYCAECNASGAEPYGFLVDVTSMFVDKGTDCEPGGGVINKGSHSMIDASLAVVGKTRAQFYADVDRSIEAFNEEMNRMHQEEMLEWEAIKNNSTSTDEN
jgi:hypothetical protein